LFVLIYVTKIAGDTIKRLNLENSGQKLGDSKNHQKL
jgi:hypothetical protein